MPFQYYTHINGKIRNPITNKLPEPHEPKPGLLLQAVGGVLLGARPPTTPPGLTWCCRLWGYSEWKSHILGIFVRRVRLNIRIMIRTPYSGDRRFREGIVRYKGSGFRVCCKERDQCIVFMLEVQSRNSLQFVAEQGCISKP